MAAIYKHGSGWQVKIRRKGFGHQHATFDSLEDAKRWARAVESKMDANLYKDITEAQRTLFKDALARYKSEVTSKKKGAFVEVYRIKMLSDSVLGSKSLAAIRSMDIAAWRDNRLAGERDNTGKRVWKIKPVSASTIIKELALISHVYTIARKEWNMKGLENPVKDVSKPNVNNARDKRIFPDEEKLLLSVAGPIIRESIIILIETAMRRGELLSLSLCDINFARRIARIAITKNGETRVVPLSSRAIEAIKSLPETINGKLVNKNGDWVTKEFKKLAKKFNLDITLHDLRHEATSRFVDSGKFSLIEIAAITGHKTMDMLKRYSHPQAEELAKRLV